MVERQIKAKGECPECGYEGEMDIVMPDLVGLSRVAEILEAQKPNVSRFVKSGRIPEPFEIEAADGSRPGSAWLKSEIVKASKVIKKWRADRGRRKEDQS